MNQNTLRIKDKDFRTIAEKHGFEVVGLSGKSHYVLEHANGCRTVCPSSPHGGKRGIQNFEAGLKRIARGHYLRDNR